MEFRWKCVKAKTGNPDERYMYAERTLQFRLGNGFKWEDVPVVWHEHDGKEIPNEAG